MVDFADPVTYICSCKYSCLYVRSLLVTEVLHNVQDFEHYVSDPELYIVL